MPSPLVTSVDWGDVVTTTLELRSKKVSDNTTNNNALLAYLRDRGNEEPVNGGREIMQELRYAENQSFMFYSGYEYLNISLNDTMTAARFPWKQAAIAVTLSGLEDLQNSGEAEMMSLITQRVKGAESTFENQMSAAIYSDGTGWGGKQINGLQALVSLTPTVGVVGGIDRSGQTWWRNASTNLGSSPTAANIVSQMNAMVVGLKRNSDGVDLIVADNNYYLAYLGALQLIQRITGEPRKKAGSGFTSLAYYGAGKEVEVVLDGGKNGQIRPNTMYFLNTDYLHFRPHARRNYKVIGGDRQNVNQDATVRIMGWAGNFTADNLSLQGALWN